MLAAEQEEEGGREEEEDTEEEENNDDDDVDSYYDDEDNDEDNDDNSIETACRRIRRNCPDFSCFMRSPLLDDYEATLLGKALKGSTQMNCLIVRIRLGGNQVTTRGAQVLGNGIQQSQIRKLIVEFPDHEYDGLAVIPTDVMQNVYLKPISMLASLDLGIRLTDSDALLLETSLARSVTLGYLAVQPHYLSPIGALALAKGIRASQIRDMNIRGAPTDSTLQVMDILNLKGFQRSQMTCLKLDESVGNVHSLATILSQTRVLMICNVAISLSQTNVFCHGLKLRCQLCQLSMGGLHMGDEHVRILSVGLRDNHSITTLYLWGNCIGDEGVNYLVESWGDESLIKDLNLGGNLIGLCGAQHLMQATARLTKLAELNLSSNRSIGYEGLELIGKALPDSLLRKLSLDNVVNWVEYEETDNCEPAKLQRVKVNQASRALVEGIRLNTYLKMLSLDQLHIPNDVGKEIHFYLSLTDEINRCGLLQHQHEIPSAFWCFLFAKYGVLLEPGVVFYFLRELPMLLVSRSGGFPTKKRRREQESNV